MEHHTNRKTTIITCASSKGGVGKTSSALSIAGILSEKRRVLLIDLDPQSAATKFLTHDDQNFDWDKTIRQVLLDEIDIQDAILTPYENFDFIPSQLKLMNIEKELDKDNPLFLISDILEPIEQEYDFIVFDTPPNIGLMSKSAFICSSHILILSVLEMWPIESIQLTWEALEKIRMAQRYINRKIKKIQITPTFFEERRELSAAFNYALRQGYTEYVSEQVIHRSVEVGKTYSTPKAKLSENMRAYHEYQKVIYELLKEHEDGKGI